MIKEIIIPIITTIIGYFLGIKNTERKLFYNAKIEFYKEFLRLFKEFQDLHTKLSTIVSIGPPFTLVDFTFKSYSEIYKTTNNSEFLLKAKIEPSKILQDYFNNLQENFNLFSNSVSELTNFIYNYTFIIKELEKELEDYIREIFVIKEKILNVNQKIIFDYAGSINEWKSWDREQIKSVLKEFHDFLLELYCYTHDLNVLIYNETVGKIFKHYKKERKPLDPNYKVLSKRGFKVNNLLIKYDNQNN